MQYDYWIGDTIRWGGNDNGEPHLGPHEVLGTPDGCCDNCGWGMIVAMLNFNGDIISDASLDLEDNCRTLIRVNNSLSFVLSVHVLGFSQLWIVKPGIIDLIEPVEINSVDCTLSCDQELAIVLTETERIVVNSMGEIVTRTTNLNG